MKKSTKRILAVAFGLMFGLGMLMGWGVLRAVAWARDLPNRVVIDGDALAESFGAAVVVSYHEVLVRGEPATQTQVLRDFSTLVSSDPAARHWVRSEFADDIRALTESQDSTVAEIAKQLSTQLGETPAQPSPSP